MMKNRATKRKASERKTARRKKKTGKEKETGWKKMRKRNIGMRRTKRASRRRRAWLLITFPVNK